MGWDDMLALADREERVLALVHEFVATFTPGELARLPKTLQPGPFADGTELRDFTTRLIRYDSEASDGGGRIAIRLSTFLARASARLREIEANIKA